MIESINNFAGFNLSAILGGTFAGIFFLLVFHYLLMPILTPFIGKFEKPKQMPASISDFLNDNNLSKSQ